MEDHTGIEHERDASGTTRRYVMTVACAFAMLLTLLDPAPLLPVAWSASLDQRTILLAGLAAAVCLVWPRERFKRITHAPSALRDVITPLAVAAVGLTSAIVAARLMLPHIFAGRINAADGDMLVVIEAGLRRLFSGANPYAIYQVPWDAPLPYGPWLWLPYALPYALHADPRVLTLVMQLTVAGACCWAAIVLARSGRIAAAVALVILASMLSLHPALIAFHRIGHTQVYWPWLLLLCLFIRREAWIASCVCVGGLVVARTTMVALVPVWLMYLHVRHELTWLRAGALGIAIVVPFLPFLVADAAGLEYALVGSYLHVMKNFVWQSTHWAHDTVGITGMLLRRGLQQYVEAAQVVVMLTTYAACALALKRGSRPEPWMVLALLMFSMTALWPVIYVYFDVVVLLAAALVAHVFDPAGAARPRPVPMLAGLCGAALLVVTGVAAISPAAAYTIDVGAPAAAGFTGAGFGRDVAVMEGGRTFVWVEGEVARVRLPRAGWTPATIHVVAKAGTIGGAAGQRVAVRLNGYSLGARSLSADWESLTFNAPLGAWFYGFNLLELRFAGTTAAALVGDGIPERRLAAAIDTITLTR